MNGSDLILTIILTAEGEMSKVISKNFREYLVNSNLNIPDDSNVWYWNNYDRDPVCVSFMPKNYETGYTIKDEIFGRLVGYNVGRVISISLLDLPLVDI